jgi:hypothetical protein
MSIKDKYGNYMNYCSEECAKIGRRVSIKKTYANKDMDLILSKRQETLIRRYGVDNAAKIPEVREHLKETTTATAEIRLQKTKINNLAKYGVESTNSLPEVKERKRRSFVEKYGVDHQLHIPEVAASVSKKNSDNAVERLAKAKETNLEKYGCENPSSNEEVKQRRTDTMIERFGVENASQNAEIHQKKIETCLKNYGVRYPQQNPEIFKKQQQGRFSLEEYDLPSGKTISIQGYEPQALDLLFKEGYKEEDFEFDNIPIIDFGFKGTPRKYYPDFYVPKEKLLIEVKSTWTFNQNKEKNLEKERACISQGYKFRFIILDARHQEVDKE